MSSAGNTSNVFSGKRQKSCYTASNASGSCNEILHNNYNLLITNARLSRLYVETEVHDVTVLHDVFFAFYAQFSSFFHCCFRTVPDIIIVFYHFRTDESFFKIGMDHTGTLRGFATS